MEPSSRPIQSQMQFWSTPAICCNVGLPIGLWPWLVAKNPFFIQFLLYFSATVSSSRMMFAFTVRNAVQLHFSSIRTMMFWSNHWMDQINMNQSQPINMWSISSRNHIENYKWYFYYFLEISTINVGKYFYDSFFCKKHHYSQNHSNKLLLF